MLKNIRTAAAGLLAAAALAGCGNNENAPQVTELDQNTAQQQALGAVSLVNGMVADIDDVTSGNLGAIGENIRRVHGLPVDRSSAEPIYNEDEGRWEFLETYSGPDGTFSYFFTVEFSDASGNSQFAPDDATSRAQFALALDMDAVSEEGGEPANLDLHYENALDITNLLSTTHDVVGAGSMTGAISGTHNGQSVDYDLAMSWGVDLDVPASGGCASGTAVVNIAPYTLSATYDAETQLYAWTFSESGNQVASGTGTGACTVASDAYQLPGVRAVDPR